MRGAGGHLGERLQDIADHRLNGSELKAANDHLAACERCSRELETLLRVKQVLAPKAASDAVPAKLRASVSQLLARERIAAKIVRKGLALRAQRRQFRPALRDDLVLVDDRHRDEVVAREDAGDLGSRGVGGDRFETLVEQSAQAHMRGIAQHALEMDHAEEPARRRLVRRQGHADGRAESGRELVAADEGEALRHRRVGRARSRSRPKPPGSR